MPDLHLTNRQRGIAFAVPKIRSAWRAALPLCLELSGDRARPLPELGEVDAYVLNDRRIARMHADFLGDPAPTDVITFEHGEIFLGAETIARHAREHGHSVDAELLLCLIHGLLHLNGFDDLDARRRQKMHRRQFQILEAVRGTL